MLYTVAMAARLKTEFVQLRLTLAEKEKLVVLAHKAQMGMSEYLRYLIHQEYDKLK